MSVEIANLTATIVGLSVASVGVGFAGYQVMKERRENRAEYEHNQARFFFQIDQLLERSRDIHVKLRNGEEEESDLPAIEAYLGAFERIEILLSAEAIDIDNFDRFYGYRILNLCNSSVVRNLKLLNPGTRSGWVDFLALVQRMVDHWQTTNSRKPSEYQNCIAVLKG